MVIDRKSKEVVLLNQMRAVEVISVKNIGISLQEQNDRLHGKFQEQTEDEDGNVVEKF